jgi:hypothetical protein
MIIRSVCAIVVLSFARGADALGAYSMHAFVGSGNQCKICQELVLFSVWSVDLVNLSV